MFQATNRSSNCQKEGTCRIARALHQIKFELEAPSGADAIRSARVVATRRPASAGDIEEARREFRKHRTLPPKAANGNGRVGIIVLRHLALECLVPAALGGTPGVVGGPMGSEVGAPIGGAGRDLGLAEKEQPVRSRGHGGVLIGSADFVRELLDRFHLGLEIGRHEVPDLARVHLRTELGLLPATGVGVRRVHAGFNSRRGGEERQTRLASAVGKVVVVDANDAVLERLAVGERHRELGAGIHGGLRLGVGGRCLALRGDVLGHGPLLTERPVLRVPGR